MTRQIDDEILMAYVDGELDEIAAREVEASIAADPDLAETVRSLRDSAMSLHAAFAEPMRGQVPDRLIATIESGFAARKRKTARSSWYGHPAYAAMAASIAVLVLGLGGTYVFVDRQVEQRLAKLEAARAADRDIIQATIATALEKQLSGVPVAWRNPESGSSGQVEPVRTFRNAAGQWCREYVLETDVRLGGARSETRRAIACREPEGRWRTRLELTSES
jgi:anti-sigma factor RsiW